MIILSLQYCDFVCIALYLGDYLEDIKGAVCVEFTDKDEQYDGGGV